MEESGKEKQRPIGPVTIAKIQEKLQQLSQPLLGVVYDVVAVLAEKQPLTVGEATMLASRSTLAKLWDSPEEDEAWAYLDEQVPMAAEGMSDYLPQLESYEEQLAQGEIAQPSPPTTTETNA